MKIEKIEKIEKNGKNANNEKKEKKEKVRKISSRQARILRGDHCLNVFVTYELKNKLQNLAERYDRTTSDMVRALMNIGIPMMEGISVAEERMTKEYIQLFRKFRKIKNIKEI